MIVKKYVGANGGRCLKGSRIQAMPGSWPGRLARKETEAGNMTPKTKSRRVKVVFKKQ